MHDQIASLSKWFCKLSVLRLYKLRENAVAESLKGRSDETVPTKFGCPSMPGMLYLTRTSYCSAIKMRTKLHSPYVHIYYGAVSTPDMSLAEVALLCFLDIADPTVRNVPILLTSAPLDNGCHLLPRGRDGRDHYASTSVRSGSLRPYDTALPALIQ